MVSLSRYFLALARTPKPLAIFPEITWICFAQLRFLSSQTPKNLVNFSCFIAESPIFIVLLMFMTLPRFLNMIKCVLPTLSVNLLVANHSVIKGISLLAIFMSSSGSFPLKKTLLSSAKRINYIILLTFCSSFI